MRKIILSLVVLTISFSAFSADPPKSTPTVKPVSIDTKAFIEKVYDYKNNSEEWKYEGDKPSIVDFWAPWCGPCRQIAPVLEELAAEYGNDIYIYKVNVDEAKELAAAFGIRSIPALLFIPMEGDPQMAMGAIPKASFKKIIDEVLLKD